LVEGSGGNVTEPKKYKIRQLEKLHAYNSEAEHYCYEHWKKAKGGKYELFWLNCFACYDDIKEVEYKEDAYNKRQR